MAILHNLLTKTQMNNFSGDFFFISFLNFTVPMDLGIEQKATLLGASILIVSSSLAI